MPVDVQLWVQNLNIKASECPNGHRGQWRRGQWRRVVGFEHEMICMKCHEVWEPDAIIEARAEHARSLVGVYGDGI